MTYNKRFRYGRALGTALLLTLPPALAGEHSNPNPPLVVSRYCAGCHGLDGNSQLPYIPRLAGLSSAYAESKLASFRAAPAPPVDEAFYRLVRIGNTSKDSGFTHAAADHMIGVAKGISDADLKDAVLWYAAQEPAPGRTARNTKVIEEGRSLYTSGVQSQHLPPCQTCHGSQAQGTATAPRLAGQNAAYLGGQLALFRAGNSNSPMTKVARYLDTNQIRAVAAYLQSR